MADAVRVLITDAIRGKKSDDEGGASAYYTGTYEPFKLKVQPGVDLADSIVVYVASNVAPKDILGVGFGPQMLPYQAEKLDRGGDKALKILSVYKRALQGRILQIIGERPKL